MHDDVVTPKRLPHYWPIVWESTGISTHKGLVMRSFDDVAFLSGQVVRETVGISVISDAMMWRHCNDQNDRFYLSLEVYIVGLTQKRRNSIANALEFISFLHRWRLGMDK